MKVHAIKRPTVVKKRRKTFVRHQANRFKRIARTGWRKQKGIDSRQRRRFKGHLPEPMIGYGSNKKTRHLLPNGFYKFVVNNPKELELLMMHNRRYCAQIAHSVSARKRKVIIKRAQQLNIKVINANARVKKEESA